MANSPRQLHFASEHTSLHWIVDDALSIRVYKSLRSHDPAFCVPSHSSELTFVLEGELWLEMGPAHQHVRLRSGEGCVLLRGTPHRCFEVPGTQFIIIDVKHPAPSHLGAIFLPSSVISPQLLNVLPKLEENMEEQSPPRLLPLVGSLLHHLPSQQLLNFEHTHNTRRMLEAKNYLECHFAESLHIHELARRLALDRFYLMRSFKQNFGLSPSAYVQFLRKERFLWSMMQNHGRRSLIDIAGEAGFPDYSTFCRRIRRELGKPPSQLFDAG